MIESHLTNILFSIAALLFATNLLGKIFSNIGLPKVAGEVVAGIMLGQTLLGHFFPNIYTWLFNSFDGHEKLLGLFYWIGLILLMFVAGFGIPQKFDSEDKKFTLLLVLFGCVPPFAFGYFISQYFINSIGPEGTIGVFSIIIAVGAAITSIPVLTSIFMDLNILGTQFAKKVLAVAAIQDFFLWAILSVALSGGNQIYGYSLTYDLTIGIVYSLVFLLLAVRILPSVLVYIGRSFGGVADPLLGWVLLYCFVITGLATIFNINIVFGAMVSGLGIATISSSRIADIKRVVSEFGICFFVPIYFGLTGMRIDLQQSFDLNLFLTFFIASSLFKICSVILCLRMMGKSIMTSLDYGITMNARGGPGIVLASLAFEAKYINSNLFVALVLTSISTSIVSGIWLRWRGNDFNHQVAN